LSTGPKPALVSRIGAAYHSDGVASSGDVDVLIECTGAPALLFEALGHVAPNGIACLTGVSSGHRILKVDAGALNNDLVLENNVVFGTVNANRRHYAAAADALARADQRWLDALLTRTVPIDRWAEAYEARPGDVKTVLTFAAL
jgi:threonine dehydrogenase-like Zn-dependent dehydrogenase